MIKNNSITLSIIAPMYNEADNIRHTIEAIQETLKNFKYKWELILVNDGSIDNTLKIAREYEKVVKNLRILSYSTNIGRGKALRTGFEFARGRFIVTIDFDLSYSPDHILKIFNKLKTNDNIDIIIGSPYMKGGKTLNVPMPRLFISRLGNIILRIAFSNKFKTMTAILRGYRKRAIDMLDLESNGKEIHIEILSKALSLGLHIVEMPAILQSRKKGKSNFKFAGTSVSHLLFTIFERPIFLFSISGAILLIIGLFLGLYILYLRYTGDLNIRPLLYLIILLIVVGTQLLSFSIISGQNSYLRKDVYKLQSRLKVIEKQHYQ